MCEHHREGLRGARRPDPRPVKTAGRHAFLPYAGFTTRLDVIPLIPAVIPLPRNIKYFLRIS